MPASRKSILFVLVQFAMLAALAWTGPLWPPQLALQGVVGGGVLLGLWALWAMPPDTFNVTPDVRAAGRLVTRGPYRYIRHPMYAALLLVAAAWVAASFSAVRLLLWTALAADLVLKLRYEEALLGRHFENYPAYQARTHRLLPWLY